MDETGLITRRRTGRLAPFVFTGVQLISPRLLRDPPTDAFSTHVFWDRAIEEGRLYGVSHEGLWIAVGSPPALPREIGRASCRERVCQYVYISVVDVSLIKKSYDTYYI